MADVHEWSNSAANNDRGASPDYLPEGQVFIPDFNNWAREQQASVNRWYLDATWGLTYPNGASHPSPVGVEWVSASSFRLTGVDARLTYSVGRRVRVVGTGTGTIYGSILESVWSSPNTVITLELETTAMANESLVVSAALTPAGLTTQDTFPLPGSIAPTENFTFAAGLNNGLTTTNTGRWFFPTNGVPSRARMARRKGFGAPSYRWHTLTSGQLVVTNPFPAVGTGPGFIDEGEFALDTQYDVYLLGKDDGTAALMASVAADGKSEPVWTWPDSNDWPWFSRVSSVRVGSVNAFAFWPMLQRGPTVELTQLVLGAGDFSTPTTLDLRTLVPPSHSIKFRCVLNFNTPANVEFVIDVQPLDPGGGNTAGSWRWKRYTATTVGAVEEDAIVDIRTTAQERGITISAAALTASSRFELLGYDFEVTP